MCHLVLLLPLLALPLFWWMAVAVAAPLYAVVLGLSGATYWYVVRAMRQPLRNGVEGMIGEFGTVVERRGAKLVVQIHNELWRAVSETELYDGARVLVVAAHGTTLHVDRAPADAIAAGALPVSRRACH